MIDRAGQEIVAKLHELNAREQRCGLLLLQEQDKTDGERVMELQARLNLLAADGPSDAILDVLAAHCIAWKLALATAEEVRVDTGAEA